MKISTRSLRRSEEISNCVILYHLETAMISLVGRRLVQIFRRRRRLRVAETGCMTQDLAK